MLRRPTQIFLVTAFLLLSDRVTRGGMILTPLGVGQGLSLSTFADQFPTASAGEFQSDGPLGIAFPSTGGVLVTDVNGTVRIFPTDADGQHAPNATITQSYGSGNATGLAQSQGALYMTQQSAGGLVQINSDGTFRQSITSGMPLATGIVSDPANGHLFVSTLSSNAIYDVNPLTKTKSLFVNADADGLAMSPDGKTLYAEVGDNRILGFDTTSKLQVFDSGLIAGSPDGAAVGTGLFANELFVNTHSGELIEINLLTSAQTLIATGGSRGDFVTVDPTNDTLLITQTDSILRLTGAATFTPTPEPATLSLVTSGLVVGATWRRRKRKCCVSQGRTTESPSLQS